MGRVMRVEGGGAQQEDLFGDAGGEISPEPVLMALQAQWSTTGVTNPQVGTAICNHNCNQKGSKCRTQLRKICF